MTHRSVPFGILDPAPGAMDREGEAMRRRTALFAVLAMVSATFVATGPLAAQSESELSARSGPERLSGRVADGFDLASPDDVVQVFIQLDEPSVAEFTATRGVASPAQQQAQGDTVQRQQARVSAQLAGMIIEERSRLTVAANGIKAMVRAGDVPAIAATDGVKSVAGVARHHLTNATSVPWIGADAVNDAGFTGENITIAIIDTGIDYTHAALGGPGTSFAYNNLDPTNDAPIFNDKVIGGHDFAGPIYNASSDDPAERIPQPDANPLDVHGHGTHVAATAAGFDPLGPSATGVAQDAQLYALKVFGDVAGSTDLVPEAIEWALDPNGDKVIDDAVDVINMSLGSDFGTPDDPSAIAAQNAADLGVVVVVASGNAGSVPYVTGSPAVAAGTLSVAASADDGILASAIEVLSPAGIAGQYEAQPGDFGPLTPATEGDLVATVPENACADADTGQVTNGPDVTGKIALIARGTCSFSAKIRAAAAAGAIGVLVTNNAEGEPIAMGQDGTPDQPDATPAMMVSLTDGNTIRAALADTVVVVLSDAVEIPKPELADTMAGFTSRGPGFGNTFKPEVSAPGVSILSAGVGAGGGVSNSSGTSMATPHVAGVAAQLIDAYPDLPAGAIKSLIMNSARGALPTDGVAVPTQGNGVVQADVAALQLAGYTTPGALSFGRINPTTETTLSDTIAITRLNGDATYDVEIVANQTVPGVSWAVSSGTVTTSGRAASLDVSVTVDPAAMSPDDGFFSQRESDGWVVLTNTGDADDRMVVGLLAVVDPASTVSAGGGDAAVGLANGGPALGFADGFTIVATGDEVAGTLAGVGYRTGSEDGYETIDFGIALTEPWASPSRLETIIFLDVDQDGSDDYALVAADLNWLLGQFDPAGVVVTALFDLNLGGGLLLYFAVADLNDHVAILPADLTGGSGFAGADITAFDMTTVIFDGDSVAALSDTVTVDLTAEITSPDGLSFEVPANTAEDVALQGTGEMLWLFQNNAVPGQFSLVEVTDGTTPPPLPPPPTPPAAIEFDDVPADHLFHTEITWLATQGITRGCNPPENTLFCPDDDVTRGQMAAFLNRALALPATDEDFFGDDDDVVFEGDINRLAAAGITRGCNPVVNDQFCPRRSLTRAEMATFMVRGFEFTDGTGSNLFVDDDGNIHESAIDILGTAGVTRGCNPPVNDRFCPDRLITRGEMAAFIYRAFQAAGLD